MKKLLIAMLVPMLCVGCLSSQVARKPTSELQLRLTQIEREIVGFHGGEEMVEELLDLRNERRAIELELLRRYQAGDRAAHLPHFR